MNQQPNFNTASPNYTIADTNSSGRVSPGLYVLIIGNYLLLILNILIVILPLVYYLLVYRNHVPDYSPYGTLHPVMTPFEFFFEVYWIRLVAGLIIFIISFAFYIYARAQSRKLPELSPSVADCHKTIKIFKSNAIVSLMILLECVSLVIFAILAIGSAFSVKGSSYIGAITAGAIVAICVFIEYIKLIKTGIQFHKWRSKNIQQL